MTFNWEEIDKIDGWLFKEEAELLYDLACIVSDRSIVVEIGSWKGKSAVAMCQSGAHVFCIDWFRGSPETAGADTYAEFKKNLAPYTNYTVIQAKSTDELPQLVTGHIGLLFIDGEHSYEACSKDFELYSQKVASGSFVVFHDAWGENGEEEHTPWPEVTRFVKELRNNPNWREVSKVRRCAVFCRVM